MATLQAARAFLLGLPQDEAYSWGLNRAIFYAAAKRGFKGGSGKTRGYPGAEERPGSGGQQEFRLGDDMAFKTVLNGKMFFTIGGKLQTKSDFEKQVVSRFDGKFEDAWKDALSLLRNYNKEELLSQSRFYSEVYKPVRDSLAEKWSELASIGGKGNQETEKRERKPPKRN
jgi:hypothetical protein